MKNNTIKKITIVTSFAYQAWSDDTIHLKPKNLPSWAYTDADQQKNEQSLYNLLSDIIDKFDLEINVYSNENIDMDICYCVFAKLFIEDQGGFSDLMKRLNKMRQERLNKDKLFIED